LFHTGDQEEKFSFLDSLIANMQSAAYFITQVAAICMKNVEMIAGEKRRIATPTPSLYGTSSGEMNDYRI